MRGTADPKGYYRLLGLPPSATSDQIRAAFRDRAKRFHPDHAGHRGNEETFQRIREAYEVLRDARRRMHYDAQGEPRSTAAPVHPKGRAFARVVALLRNRVADGWRLLSSPMAGRVGIGLSVMLMLALVVMSGLYLAARRQLDLQTGAHDAALGQLDVLRAAESDLRTRYRMANFVKLDEALGQSGDVPPSNSFVYSHELAFDSGKLAIGPEIRSELDRTITELASMIIKIPADREWVILIEGQAGPAASVDGAASPAWEGALMRVRDVIDYLVMQGLPAERLAMRFQAGFSSGGKSSSDPQTVEVKLLCCLR